MKKEVLLAAVLGSISLPAYPEARVECDSSGPSVASALSKAYSNFDESLSIYRNEDSDRPLRRFLSRIENYEIRISVRPESYEIMFLPEDYPNGALKGGGAGYKINKCTLEIDNIEPYM